MSFVFAFFVGDNVLAGPTRSVVAIVARVVHVLQKVESMENRNCIYILVYYENTYAHFLQNWPLFARVSMDTCQKRGFSETRFLLGFTVYGASEELRAGRTRPRTRRHLSPR